MVGYPGGLNLILSLLAVARLGFAHPGFTGTFYKHHRKHTISLKVGSMNYNSFFESPLRSFALSSASNLLEERTKSHQSSFIEPTS